MTYNVFGGTLNLAQLAPVVFSGFYISLFCTEMQINTIKEKLG